MAFNVYQTARGKTHDEETVQQPLWRNKKEQVCESHEALEKNVSLLAKHILVAISVGGMVQIFPLIFSGNLSQPIDTLKPLTAVQLEGRDIYIREGCSTVSHPNGAHPAA